MKDLLTRTQTQVNQGLPIYQGPRVAQFSPWQEQGMNTAVTSLQNPAVRTAALGGLEANNALASGQYMQNLDSVPGLQAMRDSIRNSVGGMLTEDFLPAIADNSIAGSGLGGSRQGVAQGIAGGKAADAIASGIGNIDFGAWQALLGQQNNALNRVGSMIETQALPGQMVSAIGAQRQAQDQANIEAGRQKFVEQTNAPFLLLDQLRASLGLGGGGSSTTTQNAADPSWLNVAMGLGGLYKSIFDKS
jgi:hypothetical protein